MADIILVFVHGWSVTNLNTYGQLPTRLRNEGAKAGMNITIKDIYLGQYVSFHDEVHLEDISRAFRTAVGEQLAGTVAAHKRFVVITHSTGGPVIRDWWDRYYKNTDDLCPMSHLIMLAPANFGSALAALGKTRLGRIDSWFHGVEPGQNVLNWLELGSQEAWVLNSDWMANGGNKIGETGIFPFVVTGQSIDRHMYDNLNSYTGELGSDGVVRAAAANLNATHVYVTQSVGKGDEPDITPKVSEIVAPETAFRILRNKSHSGTKMGIMASIREDAGDDDGSEEVDVILRCIGVSSMADYDALRASFEQETARVQADERLEIVDGFLSIGKRYFIHDKFSMIIFRVHDMQGYPVPDYDLIFTAGDDDDPNHLPEGFFMDRQMNHINRETVTYYINYDIMRGSDEVRDEERDKTIREKTPGIDKLGLILNPRPTGGFVRYYPLKLTANSDFFDKVIKPNSTTMIDICLQRMVSKNVFSLNGPLDRVPDNQDFHKILPDGNIVE